MKKDRNEFGYFLTFLGLAVLGYEIYRYWFLSIPLNPWIVIISSVIFFIGGAVIDTAKAIKIEEAIVSGSVNIIKALPLPFGKRATDKIAATGEISVIVPATKDTEEELKG